GWITMAMLEGKSLLILERDAETATGLVQAIERAGAQVVYAANVLEGLQRLAQIEFDAAVVDCGGEQDWQLIHDRLRQRKFGFVCSQGSQRRGQRGAGGFNP